MRKTRSIFVCGAILVGLFDCGLGCAWNRERIKKKNEAISLEKMQKENSETEIRIRENIKNYEIYNKQLLNDALKILKRENGQYEIEFKNNKQRLVEAIDAFKIGYMIAINDSINSSNGKTFMNDVYLGTRHNKGPYEGLRISLLLKLWSMEGENWDKRFDMILHQVDLILLTDDNTSVRDLDEVLEYIYIQRQLGYTAHQAFEEFVNHPKEIDQYWWFEEKIKLELLNNLSLNAELKLLMKNYINKYSTKSEDQTAEWKGVFLKTIRVIEFDESEALKVWNTKPKSIREHWWMHKIGKIILNSLTSGPAIKLKRDFLSARVTEWENYDGVK